MKGRFRVKLVLPTGPDSHYFYGDTLEEAESMAAALRDEIPESVQAALYVYVETSLGHVRIK